MYVIIYDYSDIIAWSWITVLCIFSFLYEKKVVYYVIGGPYVSDPKSFHCYFVYTFCKDRIKTFLISDSDFW